MRIVICSIFLMFFMCGFVYGEAANHDTTTQKKGSSALEPKQKKHRAGTGTLSNVMELFVAPSKDNPPKSLVFHPKVGGYSKYKITNKLSGKTQEMTIGVAGGEAFGNYFASWLEISSKSKQGPVVIIRFLYNPHEKGRKSISRMMIKTGNQPAVEVDLSKSKEKEIIDKTGYEIIGHKKVKVEAGEFEIERIRAVMPHGEIQELWASKKVSPFGLVRASTINYELSLVENGDGYIELCEEKPLPLKKKKKKRELFKKQKK